MFCFDPHHKSKGRNFLISERAGIQIKAVAGLSILTCSQEVRTSPVAAKITEAPDESPAICSSLPFSMSCLQTNQEAFASIRPVGAEGQPGQGRWRNCDQEQLCLRRTGRKVPPRYEVGPNLSSTEQSGSGRHLKGEPNHRYAAWLLFCWQDTYWPFCSFSSTIQMTKQAERLFL